MCALCIDYVDAMMIGASLSEPHPVRSMEALCLYIYQTSW